LYWTDIDLNLKYVPFSTLVTLLIDLYYRSTQFTYWRLRQSLLNLVLFLLYTCRFNIY